MISSRLGSILLTGTAIIFGSSHSLSDVYNIHMGFACTKHHGKVGLVTNRNTSHGSQSFERVCGINQ
ncbi:MAG: hypothetical protein WCG25_02670 [bacterium]